MFGESTRLHYLLYENVCRLLILYDVFTKGRDTPRLEGVVIVQRIPCSALQWLQKTLPVL